jgi:hypothetical protein
VVRHASGGVVSVFHAGGGEYQRIEEQASPFCGALIIARRLVVEAVPALGRQERRLAHLGTSSDLHFLVLDGGGVVVAVASIVCPVAGAAVDVAA